MYYKTILMVMCIYLFTYIQTAVIGKILYIIERKKEREYYTHFNLVVEGRACIVGLHDCPDGESCIVQDGDYGHCG